MKGLNIAKCAGKYGAIPVTRHGDTDATISNKKEALGNRGLFFYWYIIGLQLPLHFNIFIRLNNIANFNIIKVVDI
jgi:hypothetical protein